MSLVFALLREDYIVFASDRRHTRHDSGWGLYANNDGFKTMELLSGTAMLGFAGDDLGESIISHAKADGIFNNVTLEAIATGLSEFAKKKYVSDTSKLPDVQILLTGFASEKSGQVAATCWTLRSLDPTGAFHPIHAAWPFGKFEVIGRSNHGALYALHRLGGFDPLSERSALQLAAFTLFEICECDKSCGGQPNIYVIPRTGHHRHIENQEIVDLHLHALASGQKLKSCIISGPVQPDSTHDP